MQKTDPKWRDLIEKLTEEGFSINNAAFIALGRWTHVLHQLDFARRMVVNLILEKPKHYDEQNYVEHYAHFSAMVISYGRCFVGSGTKVVSLDKNNIFKDRLDLLPTHDKIMMLRNKVIAHNNDSDFMRVTIADKEYNEKVEIRHREKRGKTDY